MRHRSIATVVLAAAFAAASLAGCAMHVQHPGTANAFDSDIYDTLLVSRSVIETTKTDLAASAFPVSIAGNVQSALNNLISAYNLLEGAYCGVPVANTQGTLDCASTSIHAAIMTGTATPAQTAQLTQLSSSVNSAVTALAASKGAQ